MNAALPNTGWQAHLKLNYAVRRGKTCLVDRYQRGPLAVQKPFYPEGEVCHNYVLHPPGGVVGGDSITIEVHSESGAHSLLTTPGATKFYRAKANLYASQTQNLSVAKGAVLEWLPQENIFFPGANAKLSNHIELASGARYIGWEMHCFGRPAIAETFDQGQVSSITRVSIDGELRLVEKFRSSAIQSSTGLRGLPMQGAMIVAPCSEAERDVLLPVLQASNYQYPIATSLVDEVLVVRALGQQTEPMLQVFRLLWSELRLHWLQRQPCAPRIWAT